ncbi:MAG: carboxymuconolactone decarboxylase family protein [Jatrophihabitans sp.]|nr:MAG: carboxymuconolactone decarboxylase family protein [Jatrophihabitans sp.]
MDPPKEVTNVDRTPTGRSQRTGSDMPRIPYTDPTVYEPVFGPGASPAQQVFAHSPEIAQAYLAFGDTARRVGVLPFRLVELVRLRVAFHNQCKLCMSLRYEDGDGAPVEEGLVCSLEQPYETDRLSPAERAAIAFADKMATDHLAIGDAMFEELRTHFTDAEVMELCFRVAANVGFGRMAAVLDVIPQEDLPVGLRGAGVHAPWTAFAETSGAS